MAENPSLYKRLKRMFSTGVIVRRVGDKKLKVADTAQIQSGTSNATRDKYFRMYNASGHGTSQSAQYTLSMAYQQQRILLFRDYDIMDSDSIIHSALDAYAEESTTRDENGAVLRIECEDDNIKEILHNLFYDILNVEHTLYMWVRNIAKYGDMFLFLEISEEYGVVNVLPLSVYDTLRIEGSDPSNPYYYYFETRGMAGRSQKLEAYEIAHFRLNGDANFLPYGMSMLEGARRVFRQIVLMEDAMIIHRIMRAPEKRKFFIEVGNIPPGEVQNFITKQINQNKKVPFIDEVTGQYNLSFNMQNILEDFYFPVRGKSDGTDVQNLGGLEYNPIDDIEYLRQRMLASLRIPKAYLGFDDGSVGKVSLAQEDVRFARTIERIQKTLESELYKIGIVHLYAQGYKDERLVDFKIKLTNPSTIAEQEKINLWKERTLVARDLKDLHLFSSEYIYKHFYNLSEAEIEQERIKILEDSKRDFRIAQIEQGMSDPVKFGFPQNKSPEELGMMQPGAMPPAGGAGGPPMGGPPAGGAPEGGAPMGESMDLERGLVHARPITQKELERIANGEDIEEVMMDEQNGPGQPRKGSSYGQDNHYAGRDPLGGDERYEIDPSNVRDREDKPKRAFEMTNEYNQALKAFDKKFKKMLKEEVEEEVDDYEPGYMREESLKKYDESD